MNTTIFLIISIIFFNGIAIITPKRLTKLEMLSVSVFVLLLQTRVDVLLDLKYDLYGYFEKGIEIKTFFTFLGIFPAFTIIMLNYYPYGKRFIRKLDYIIIVTVFCLIYEFLSTYSGFFYYINWSLLYSAMCYPPLILILTWYLSLIRKLISLNYLKKK